MNTRIRIRLLLLVLAIGLAVPCVANADLIPIAYVAYQNVIPPVDPAHPGTNAFYFEWLVDQLTLTEATLWVRGTDLTGAIATGPVALRLPIDRTSPLGGLEFPTSTWLTSVHFSGSLGPAVLTFGGRDYDIAAQAILGGMTADAPGLLPLGLGDSYDFFVLEALADPVPVAVPEGGPGILAMVIWGGLLAAAARRAA